MTPYLDANVIIRFLTGDHPDHSARATELLDRAGALGQSFKVLPHILCEVVYVLEGATYGYSRQDISDRILQLSELPCIAFEAEESARTSLVLYAEHNVDFADALLAALAGNARIYTFNAKHFNRLPCDSQPPPTLEQ